MSLKSLLIALGLGIAFSGLVLPLSTARFTTASYTVPGGEILEVRVSHGSKDRIVGFFSFRGEPPEIGFRVLTPKGEPMVYHFEPDYVQFRDGDVVVARHNFNFLARSQGDYILQLDNRNYSQGKKIDMRLTIMPAFYGIHPTNLLIILGFAVVFLGYMVEDIKRRKYVEVLPEDFKYEGGGIFSWKRDPLVRVNLKKQGVEVIEELRKFGLTPKSKWGFYYSLRNRAGLE